MKYLVRIRFVGSEFCGFQFQPGKRTVQGVLTDAFREMFACDCAVTGCSRTDSGVHAREFCITVEPHADGANVIPPELFPQAAIRHMPRDISVISCEVVGDDFHPRYDALGKEYIYKIYYSRTPDPFLNGRVWRIPRNISDVDVDAMDAAARLVVGERDFASFMASGSKITDTVRTVYRCCVERDGDTVTLRISANGFLYNMVRIIAGTLAEVGEGKRAPEWITEVIAARNRAAAGRTAPPDGLYLNRVFYDSIQ